MWRKKKYFGGETRRRIKINKFKVKQRIKKQNRKSQYNYSCSTNSFSLPKNLIIRTSFSAHNKHITFFFSLLWHPISLFLSHSPLPYISLSITFRFLILPFLFLVTLCSIYAAFIFHSHVRYILFVNLILQSTVGVCVCVC